MHNMVEYALKNHEKEIIESSSKFDFLKKKLFRNNSNSFLLARARRHAYNEAYGLIKGTLKSSTALKTTYSTPKHNPNRILISDIDIKINQNPELKEFDMLLEIRCFDSRTKGRTIVIPLKKHKHFLKWLNFPGSKLNNAVIVTDKYIQFSFEIEVKKKDITDNNIIGCDPGAKNLLTDDEGNFYGENIWSLLQKIRRKKRCSKAWYKAKSEIIQYIDHTCKNVPWYSLSLFVLEDNRKIKNKMKFKGRLNKNIRSSLTNWSISRINDRCERLCEENGVSLRRVPAYYNSTKCPICGHCEKANRASQSEFICLECGHTEHADKIGAINSFARFALGPFGAECKHLFFKKHSNYNFLVNKEYFNVIVGNKIKMNGKNINGHR